GPGAGDHRHSLAAGHLDGLLHHGAVLAVRQRRRLPGRPAGHDAGDPSGGLVAHVVRQTIEVRGRAVPGKGRDEGRICPAQLDHDKPPAPAAPWRTRLRAPWERLVSWAPAPSGGAAAASHISRFISATAWRRPTKTDRLTMEWPMCNSCS